MKKLSITKKITLWYAFFLLVIAVCFFGLILWVGQWQTAELSKGELKEEVVEAGRELTTVGGTVHFAHDFRTYDDGVYVAMFKKNGQMIEGRNPLASANTPNFNQDQISEYVDQNGVKWYLYDVQYEVDGKTVWVRGHKEDVAIAQAYSLMIKLGLLYLPLLLCFAIVGGFLITRRSFLPVRKIIDCVESVEKDRDFSKRIDVSEEIEESNDEIDQLSSNFNTMFDTIETLFNKEKQFTSDVSHELRTPLALIIAQSDYALSDETYKDEALVKIKDEAKRMADLVSKLLLLSRSDIGTVKLDKEVIDFSELCQTVAEQQSLLLDETKNIEVMTDIEDDIFIIGDEATIIRVLLNITENAVKYGNNSHGEKSIIRITLKNNNGIATCSISDNGDGIAPEDLDQIWDKFYRVEKSRTKEGNGLGLSMAKALVEANKGQITVESILGLGSCFNINFATIESEKK